MNHFKTPLAASLGALFLSCLLWLTPSSAQADTLEVPVQVGLGPAFYFMTGPIGDNQAPHYGVRIYAKAILKKRALRKVRKKVPREYRKLLRKTDELRIGHMLIPESIIISPRTQDVGMFGMTWRFIKLDIPLLKNPRLTVGSGLLLTYAFIDVALDAEGRRNNPLLAEGTTHFLRPGISAAVNLEIPVTDAFLLSFGWSSGFYVPQEIGGSILSVGNVNKGIWHIGEAYGLLNFRFPYKTRL